MNATQALNLLDTNELRHCLELRGHTGLDQLDADQVYALALEAWEDAAADLD